MKVQQSNTQVGARSFVAAEDLTGKQGFLAKLTDNAGTPEIALPTDNGDVTPYVILTGVAAAADVDVLPLDSDSNARAELEGTCVAGDVLVLADTVVVADRGKLRKLPAAPGNYRGIGVAEETGEDGQLVLFRPSNIGVITV